MGNGEKMIGAVEPDPGSGGSLIAQGHSPGLRQVIGQLSGFVQQTGVSACTANSTGAEALAQAQTVPGDPACSVNRGIFLGIDPAIRRQGGFRCRNGTVFIGGEPDGAAQVQLKGLGIGSAIDEVKPGGELPVFLTEVGLTEDFRGEFVADDEMLQIRPGIPEPCAGVGDGLVFMIPRR